MPWDEPHLAAERAHQRGHTDVYVARVRYNGRHTDPQCTVHSFAPGDGPGDTGQHTPELRQELRKTFSPQELSLVDKVGKGHHLDSEEQDQVARDLIVTKYKGDIMVFPFELCTELLTEYMGQLPMDRGGEFSALWYHVLRPAIENLMPFPQRHFLLDILQELL